ncbi:hypothetical protein C9374_003714 [Naegleria lovaniensis]|uniref:Uncharacterized protein n=1 Tax=Naegleria lovaniensis TaxID=51637 RepID=A0AA88GZR4_NAELO|nr:uncharacterized protein C9374_003714 [Naegleria lovaniensis]KAG2393950.1 hypothetical protein C9374_003714 [Naegleria lovaniensis]
MQNPSSESLDQKSIGEYFVVFGFMSFSILIHLYLPLPSIYVFKAYLIYFVFQYAMARFLPGKIVKGLPLEDGTVLEYNCNGLQAYLITLVLFFTGGHLGWWRYSIVYDHLLEFVAITSIFHWCYWLIVFIKGRMLKKREYNDGLLREIWLGAERNPRILGVDCKLFFDGRPSLLTWVVVAFSYASVQYEKYGTISTPMAMYLIFSFLYMLDFFVTEDQFITGFEIYQERFGFMLSWGNFVWMPFVCTAQAYYLIEWSDLPLWGVIAVSVLWIFGYVVARLSNAQKDKFKRDPNAPFLGIKPKYIETEQGRKVLVNGFWSLSRHPNYFGELANSLSFGLMCGFDKGIFPYSYSIFIWVLLFTRYERDHKKMKQKYGKSFERYCSLVPYKIIPYVY